MKSWTREVPIVTEMTQLLADSTADDATLNGHLIFTLNQMEATSAAIAIIGAFNHDKVDTRVMTIHDVEFLGDMSW